MTSIGLNGAYPNSLVLDRWNGLDLAQWGSGAAAFSSSGVSTGGVTLATGASNGSFPLINVSISMTTSAAGYWCFLFTPRVTLPNRYIVCVRYANGVQSAGTLSMGTMWASTASSGASHFAFMSLVTASGTTYNVRKVEAGALIAGAGTAPGAAQTYTSGSPGLLLSTIVDCANPVVTNPSFYSQHIAWAGAQTQCGGLLSTDVFASYTGFNGLSLNNVGIGGTWTTAATQTGTVEIQDFYILRHYLDW